MNDIQNNLFLCWIEHFNLCVQAKLDNIYHLKRDKPSVGMIYNSYAKLLKIDTSNLFYSAIIGYVALKIKNYQKRLEQ